MLISQDMVWDPALHIFIIGN